MGSMQGLERDHMHGDLEHASRSSSALGYSAPWGAHRWSTTQDLILPLTTGADRSTVPVVRPEIKEQILPIGLLAAGVVTGGICWTLEGTAFWVMVGVTLALIIAGMVIASRTEAARRDK